MCWFRRHATDLHLCASVDGHQCFPFYVYDEDGTNRHENITDWALEHFRKHYGDEKITKWDIFYYVYGVLHHPEYRAKYAENLKRELPRIPLAGAVILRSEATKNLGSEGNEKDPSASPQDDSERAQDDSQRAPHDKDNGPPRDKDGFWAFAKAGKELAELHVDYERLEPYPLKFVETNAVAPGFSPASATSSLRSEFVTFFEFQPCRRHKLLFVRSPTGASEGGGFLAAPGGAVFSAA